MATLIELTGLAETATVGVYVATIIADVDDHGDHEEIEYGVVPGDTAGIALDVSAAVQTWLNNGGQVQPYTPPTDEQLREEMPPLSARQFRLGLITSGRVLEQVDEAIAAIEDAQERAAAQIEWQYATSFRRLHPLVVNLSIHLGFTPEEVDALWMDAQEQ